MDHAYDLRVAGILIRILAPRELQFLDCYQPFLDTMSSSDSPDWIVEVYFDTQNIPLSDGDLLKRFPRNNGDEFLRVVPADRVKTCRLFVPADMADSFCRYANWNLFLMFDELLLPHDRVILHASAVVDRGKAILFTAPSGGGKSTQASIWEKTFGSEILNGDKVVIAANEAPPVGYGSPIAGSSGIYKNIHVPIRAIVYLHKGDENHVRRMDDRRAFMALYSQVVKSHDDASFNRALIPLLAKIVENVPVLELTCRPEPAAAACVRAWLDEHAM